MFVKDSVTNRVLQGTEVPLNTLYVKALMFMFLFQIIL